MFSSAVRTFSDPDDYAASVQQRTVELTVTGRGAFTAILTRIDLHRLSLQRFSDNLPRVAHVAAWAGRTILAFRTRSGPSLAWSGLEMRPGDIVRHGDGQSHSTRSSGCAGLGTMSLPSEDLVSLEPAAGVDLTPLRDAVLVTPPPAAMARLQRLHSEAARLAEEAPEIIADPNAARGLEQALIEGIAGCLVRRDEPDSGAARGQHAIVMRRFRRMLEENPEQLLYIPEICKAIRVSERTLRICCQEHLGMSPKRYLVLRRMHLARRALRAAAPDATVTEIATRYGFWQLGRFAVEYRALFGETPSATLRRQSNQPHTSSAACPWIVGLR
jgi:AraC-like DNA-binding protein